MVGKLMLSVLLVILAAFFVGFNSGIEDKQLHSVTRIIVKGGLVAEFVLAFVKIWS